MHMRQLTIGYYRLHKSEFPSISTVLNDAHTVLKVRYDD